MRSHRAGRWGFDRMYARLLIERVFIVDCSVTPGVCWQSSLGNPHGHGGPDFRNYPRTPYFINPDDISRPCHSGLLEIPVTIQPTSPETIGAVRGSLPARSLPRRA